MSYYITDDEISNRCFEGETVPGDNSIDAARNTSYKATVTNIINIIVGRKIADGNFDDEYGLGKEYALILYSRLSDNDKENPVDEETDAFWIKQIVRKHGNVPLTKINPSTDWSRLR